jgi:hypothetical protein
MTKRTTLDTGWNRAECREFDERHCQPMNGIDPVRPAFNRLSRLRVSMLPAMSKKIVESAMSQALAIDAARARTPSLASR